MHTETGASAPTTTPVAPARASWLVPTLVFALTFVVFALTASRVVWHIDAHAATVESWHIAATGNPWLEHSLNDGMRHNKFIGEAPNGHVVGMRMAGPVLAGIPFYLLLDRSPDGADFSLGPGGIAASFWTALAVMLLFLALRPRLGTRLSLGAVAVFAFGTPTWSVSANMLWTHPVTQLGIAGAALAASRGRWWLAGAALGVGMLGRPHLAVVAAVLGLGLAWSKRDVRPLLGLAVPTLTSLAALLLWGRWMFGTWSLEAGGYGGKIAGATQGYSGTTEYDVSGSQLLNFLGFLVAPNLGFLVWTPVLLLLVPAVVRAWREVPVWSRYLALGGVAYTVVQLRINYFAGGDGFYGYRYGLELLTCLVPLVAFSLPWLGATGRRVVPVVAALQVGAIMLGAVTESFQVPIEDVWTDNSLWLALRTVPAVTVVWMLLWLVVGVVAAVVVNRLGEAPVAPGARAAGSERSS